MTRESSPTPKQPLISWGESFETGNLFCSVSVPRSWLIENSHWKRRLQLWWWLTRLAWSLPK